MLKTPPKKVFWGRFGGSSPLLSWYFEGGFDMAE